MEGSKDCGVHVVSRRMVLPSTPPPMVNGNDGCHLPTVNGNGCHRRQEEVEVIHLTPWDLRLISIDYIQKGILLPKPPAGGDNDDGLVNALQSSFALALQLFYPFAGRLASEEHADDGTVSVFLQCTGEGAEFVHAVAPEVAVADIVSSLYTPAVVRNFYPLALILGADAAIERLPVLAVQVTVLADGMFIAMTLNHSVGDGTAFWHFINTWSEINRASSGGGVGIVSSADLLGDLSMPPPVFKRWFLETCPVPIPMPFRKLEDIVRRFERTPVKECFFTFSAASVKKLKARANDEMAGGATATISSLQAVLAHFWRAACRARRLPPERGTFYSVVVGCRGRVDGIPPDYLGNALVFGKAEATAGEIEEKGLGCTRCTTPSSSWTTRSESEHNTEMRDDAQQEMSCCLASRHEGEEVQSSTEDGWQKPWVVQVEAHIDDEMKVQQEVQSSERPNSRIAQVKKSWKRACQSLKSLIFQDQGNFIGAHDNQDLEEVQCTGEIMESCRRAYKSLMSQILQVIYADKDATAGQLKEQKKRWSNYAMKALSFAITMFSASVYQNQSTPAASTLGYRLFLVSIFVSVVMDAMLIILLPSWGNALVITSWLLLEVASCLATLSFNGHYGLAILAVLSLVIFVALLQLLEIFGSSSTTNGGDTEEDTDDEENQYLDHLFDLAQGIANCGGLVTAIFGHYMVGPVTAAGFFFFCSVSLGLYIMMVITVRAVARPHATHLAIVLMVLLVVTLITVSIPFALHSEKKPQVVKYSNHRKILDIL